MKEFWNNRYSVSDFVYGKEPNLFFKSVLEKLDHGRLLLPFEGEGRNAVFAAGLGWDVYAIDYSEEAKAKAIRLASEQNLKINYQVQDIKDYEPEMSFFDCAALVYAHPPVEMRDEFHSKIKDSIKPGGQLIIEVFDKDQLKYNSGGPREEDLLYSLEDIYTVFNEFEIDQFSKETIELSEGAGHQGKACVIRYSGKKPSP